MSITKEIGYAYPTSIIAKQQGFSDMGCWYLAICDGDKIDLTKDIVFAHPDKFFVLAAAAHHPHEWSAYSMHKGINL
jgi:hypothetical protein